MAYYDQTPEKRKEFYKKMEMEISSDISTADMKVIKKYSSDLDTYIRKNCYLILGRLYKMQDCNKPIILSILDELGSSSDEKIRQTVLYTLGEIGKHDFDSVKNRINVFLNDSHHSVKNGLTGAIKQMGEKNPGPVFSWAKNVIKKCNSDIREKILHGLELRGRTHPEDLLPILKDVFNDNITNKTKKMLVHIIGQISYKEGCLEKVINEINKWNNKDFITECKKEIIKIHKSYSKFSILNPEEAEKLLSNNLE